MIVDSKIKTNIRITGVRSKEEKELIRYVF